MTPGSANRSNFLPRRGFALCSLNGLAADAGIVDRCGNGRFISVERSPAEEILVLEGYALWPQYRQ